jgi:hypothetical protein
MMKHQQKYSRRTLMKALGVGAALIPLLESDPADAACLVSGVKRLFILAWPNGMLSGVSQWANAGETPDTWQLPAFQASLEPYKQDLLLVDGVDYDFLRDGPHSELSGHACLPGMLTGALYMKAGSGTGNDIAGGPSIDQYIGSTLRAAGYTGLTSLNLGVFVDSTARLSWRAAGDAVIPDFDPNHVFNTYFAGIAGAPAAPNLVKRSVLDFVGKELNRFMGVVGSEDKRAIQKHLDLVRSIELRLDAANSLPAPGSPTSSVVGDCSAQGIVQSLALHDTNNVPALAKMQMDLSIAAFGADLTRVVVMQIGDQIATHLILSWPPCNFKSGGPSPGDANSGDVNGYHSISKRNGADKLVCDTWFQSQCAYMIGRLKSIADASGQSLLHNSAFLAMNNMRDGLGATIGVPLVMAGSCGGYFKTGRSLALTGVPNNQVLVALCNAMGAPTQTFGYAPYGGELSVLKS